MLFNDCRNNIILYLYRYYNILISISAIHLWLDKFAFLNDAKFMNNRFVYWPTHNSSAIKMRILLYTNILLFWTVDCKKKDIWRRHLGFFDIVLLFKITIPFINNEEQLSWNIIGSRFRDSLKSTDTFSNFLHGHCNLYRTVSSVGRLTSRNNVPCGSL